MASDQPPQDPNAVSLEAVDGTQYRGADVPQLSSDPVPVLLDGSLDDVQDRYEDPRQLGEGGMGVVTLVRDRRIGRDIALKKLKPIATTDAIARKRFAREARVQGQLEHPAVVPVYDLAASTDGSLFFTMKRVHGKSLVEVLRSLASNDAETVQQFSRRRLLTAFSQICLAAHYAHERGVVHRDIKP